MSLRHPTLRSFSFAFNGLKTALKTEPNLRIHFIITIFVISTALILGFSALELSILTLTIGFVLILELINTSLEALTDIVSPEIQEKARLIKDVSAAAVLIASFLSLFVGFFLFFPKLLRLF